MIEGARRQFEGPGRSIQSCGFTDDQRFSNKKSVGRSKTLGWV